MIKAQKHENHKMYFKSYRLWRDYDLMCTILSSTGLLIQFVNYEYEKSQPFQKRDPIAHPNPMNDPVNGMPTTNLVRMVVFVLTILALICLVQRHLNKREWKNQCFNLDNKTYAYYKFQECFSEHDDKF
jgi:hypothetical protein